MRARLCRPVELSPAGSVSGDLSPVPVDRCGGVVGSPRVWWPPCRGLSGYSGGAVIGHGGAPTWAFARWGVLGDGLLRLRARRAAFGGQSEPARAPHVADDGGCRRRQSGAGHTAAPCGGSRGPRGTAAAPAGSAPNPQRSGRRTGRPRPAGWGRTCPQPQPDRRLQRTGISTRRRDCDATSVCRRHAVGRSHGAGIMPTMR